MKVYQVSRYLLIETNFTAQMEINQSKTVKTRQFCFVRGSICSDVIKDVVISTTKDMFYMFNRHNALLLFV